MFSPKFVYYSSTACYPAHLRVLRRTRQFDRRTPLITVFHAEKNRYIIVSGMTYFIAGVQEKLSPCFVRVLDVTLSELRDNELEMLEVFSKLSTPLSFAPSTGIMHQVRDMKVLLDFNSSNSVVVPSNPSFGFNSPELASLVPSHLVFDQGRHFVLKKDEKLNRGGRKLLQAGVLQRLFDLEIENPLWEFSYETLRKFSESNVEIGHIKLQVSDWERDSTKTNRLVYTVSIFKRKRKSKPLRKESCDIKAGSASSKPTKETRRKDIGRDQTSNSVTEIEKTSSAPVEVRIPKLQHLFEVHGCSGFMLPGEHYDQGMSDTKYLSDDLVSFAAMDIMDGSSDGDIRFAPHQFAHRMLPDRTNKAFQKKFVDSGIDIVLFSMTVSNHYSLTAIFGLRDAFDSIKDGVTRAPGNACPVKIVLLDRVLAVGHYNHVVTHIVPWLQKISSTSLTFLVSSFP